MTATELTGSEASAKLGRAVLLHEAAHASATWLMGGQVHCVSGLGFARSSDSEPAKRAVGALAGPAMDALELGWLTEAHLEMPEVRDINEQTRAVADTIEQLVGNGGTPETDTDRARRHLARLQGHPDLLYARAWRVASELVAGSDTRLLIEEVADSLDETEELDAEAFLRVAEPFLALRQAYLFAAPWVDVGLLTKPSELLRSELGTVTPV